MVEVGFHWTSFLEPTLRRGVFSVIHVALFLITPLMACFGVVFGYVRVDVPNRTVWSDVGCLVRFPKCIVTYVYRTCRDNFAQGGF